MKEWRTALRLMHIWIGVEDNGIEQPKGEGFGPGE